MATGATSPADAAVALVADLNDEATAEPTLEGDAARPALALR
jgi:hypothetical protein